MLNLSQMLEYFNGFVGQIPGLTQGIFTA